MFTEYKHSNKVAQSSKINVRCRFEITFILKNYSRFNSQIYLQFIFVFDEKFMNIIRVFLKINIANIQVDNYKNNAFG